MNLSAAELSIYRSALGQLRRANKKLDRLLLKDMPAWRSRKIEQISVRSAYEDLTIALRSLEELRVF